MKQPRDENGNNCRVLTTDASKESHVSRTTPQKQKSLYAKQAAEEFRENDLARVGSVKKESKNGKAA